MSKDKNPTPPVPRLRFPEFRDAPPWVPTSLAEAFRTITNGKANAQDHDEDGKYPLFDRSETIKRSPEYLFDAEAVILPGEGAHFTPRRFGGKFNLHQRAYALMDCREDIDFAYYAIDEGKGRLASKAVKSTVLSLRMPIIEKFTIACPDPKEQRKIAECLGSLDDWIAAETDALAALRRHKTGLMQQLFPRPGETRPRLRFPEFAKSKGWVAHKLGDVVAISKGKGVAKADVVEGGATPCIRYAELYTVYGEVISEVKSSTNVPVDNLVLSEADDVIVPASGETKEDIATCACVMDSGVALGSDLNVLRSEIDGRFFSYYLNSAKRSELAKLAQGDTVAHLYPSQISQLDINIPPDTDEQRRIADCLVSLDLRIAGLTDQIAALHRHKRGLMQQLFPSPDLQPGEAP